MPLHLAIENESSLPDGGPISCSVNSKRGIDIGRDQYLDWVLPDPTRFISGKHCEIRYRDGRYWLTDVSTNGTFVNRSEARIDRAYPLQNGDRIEIGRYIIAVTVEPEAGEVAQAPVQAAAQGGAALWNVGDDAAPAINPRELRSPSVSTGVNSFDVLDWAADIPTLASPPPGSAMPLQPAPSFGEPGDWTAPPARQDSARGNDMPRDAVPAADMPRPARPPAAASPPPDPQGWSMDIDPLPDLVTDGPTAQPTGARPAPGPFAPETTHPPGASEALPPSPTEPPAAPVPVMAAPPPMAASQVAPRSGGQGATVIQRFAKGLGLPVEAIAIRDEGELAELLGALMLSVAENLSQLHAARAQTKGMMRSSNQTLIQAADNNPLRFSPTAKDALRIMFGPQTRSYLDVRRTIDSSFSDLKSHQLMTFSAMQSAVTKLMEDIDPKRIDALLENEKGVSGLIGSRKAKLWERYVTIWQAKTGRNDLGMLGVFMLLFADAYDKPGKGP